MDDFAPDQTQTQTQIQSRSQPACPPGDDRLTDMFDYRLYLLYRDSGQLMERMIQTRFGINRRRWRIIAALNRACEGATLSEIAQAAELDRAQASRTVGTMCREGYLKRLSNPHNARYAKVVFTDKSRTLYDEIIKEWGAANRLLLAALTPDEVAALDTIFDKLRQRSQQLRTQVPFSANRDINPAN